MSWPTGNVPPAVSAMRDMIVATATAVANSIVQADIHYPELDLTASGVMPAILIVQEDEQSTPYAAGSGSIPTGRIRLEYYDDKLAGDIEKIAFGIKADLAGSQTGLLIRSTSCSLASDPTPAENADIDDADTVRYRVCTITVEFGPNL